MPKIDDPGVTHGVSLRSCKPHEGQQRFVVGDGFCARQPLEQSAQICVGFHRSAALAAQSKNVRAAMVRRDNETVSELLMRLDAALARALANNTAVDEVLPEIKRRRSR